MKTPQQLIAAAALNKNTLTTIAKVGAGLLAVVSGVWIYNKVTNQDSNKGDNNQSLRELARKGIRPQFTASEYASWADAIYSVMNHSAVDEAPNSVLWGVLGAIKNQADWIRIKQEYGTRQLYAWGLKDGKPGNITTHLGREGLLDKTTKILQQKGIVA